jgi:hypothetical protein
VADRVRDTGGDEDHAGQHRDMGVEESLDRETRPARWRGGSNRVLGALAVAR